MAKKSMIAREKKRQHLVNKYNSRRQEIKASIKSASSMKEKFEGQLALQKLPRNSAPIRLHNRCAFTGRPKGYYRDFGISRHELRSMAHQCLLPGLRKASW